MDSKLQIISGEYRGRKLKMPTGVARPTQNLARGAVFNMLSSILGTQATKIKVWDAFAGSGALGIEVLSRYCESNVIFTDVSDESMRTIADNVRGIDSGRYKLDKNDAVERIREYGLLVNLVFVDPPYADAFMGIKFVEKLADFAAANTIVVQEIESSVDYAPDETKWEVLRDKKYGRARFLVLLRR